MSTNRTGEQGDPPYRSKRIYRANGQWFFDTREGTQFGPFRTPEEARMVLAFFVAQNVHASKPRGAAGEEPPGRQDGIEHMVQEVLEVLACFEDYGHLAARTWVGSRLEDLELKDGEDPVAAECREVLLYALEHAEQLFDFGVFLESSA